jgi:hypothetical protein
MLHVELEEALVNAYFASKNGTELPEGDDDYYNTMLHNRHVLGPFSSTSPKLKPRKVNYNLRSRQSKPGATPDDKIVIQDSKDNSDTMGSLKNKNVTSGFAQDKRVVYDSEDGLENIGGLQDQDVITDNDKAPSLPRNNIQPVPLPDEATVCNQTPKPTSTPTPKHTLVVKLRYTLTPTPKSTDTDTSRSTPSSTIPSEQAPSTSAPESTATDINCSPPSTILPGEQPDSLRSIPMKRKLGDMEPGSPAVKHHNDALTTQPGRPAVGVLIAPCQISGQEESQQGDRDERKKLKVRNGELEEEEPDTHAVEHYEEGLSTQPGGPAGPALDASHSSSGQEEDQIGEEFGHGDSEPTTEDAGFMFSNVEDWLAAFRNGSALLGGAKP